METESECYAREFYYARSNGGIYFVSDASNIEPQRIDSFPKGFRWIGKVPDGDTTLTEFMEFFVREYYVREPNGETFFVSDASEPKYVKIARLPEGVEKIKDYSDKDVRSQDAGPQDRRGSFNKKVALVPEWALGPGSARAGGTVGGVAKSRSNPFPIPPVLEHHHEMRGGRGTRWTTLRLAVMLPLLDRACAWPSSPTSSAWPGLHLRHRQRPCLRR